MKISKLVEKLNRVLVEYKNKYPEVKNPEIFSFDEDEGILICASVKKTRGIRTAKKPYLKRKLGIERLL